MDPSTAAAAAASAPGAEPAQQQQQQQQHKRPLDLTDADADGEARARDAMLRERRALEQLLQGRSAGSPPPSWSQAALSFARAHLHQSDAVREFRQLCDSIMQATPAVAAAAAAASPAVAGQEERKQSEAPTLPPMQPALTVAPPVLPAMAAPSPAASPLSSPTASPPAAAAAAAAPSPPSDLLATLSDVSLLVPRGKFQLQLSSQGATFAVPATPAKSLSFPWSSVLSVFDVADVNKRDWLVVILLKKGSGLMVGKQTHHALVIKMLATEKMKEGRVTLGAPIASTELAQVQQRMHSFVDLNAGEVKFNTGIVSLLRLIPALSGVPFVAHDPAIFTSQKQLPCVSCKLGVEDGALYLLRTGLLFIKPVLFISLADLDGITPARGMSSTFDMKVGVVGQKGDTAFIMIDPKEEGAIAKYCTYLGVQQARMEKEEARAKAAAAAAPEAAAAAASSAAPSAAAASSSSSPIDLRDSDDHAAAAAPAAAAAAVGSFSSPDLFDDKISPANVLAAGRSSRRARPASFVGMDDGEEVSVSPAAAAAAAAKAKGPKHAADDDDDDNSDSSSDEEEWSGGSGSDASSSDSAEYDSDKDGEEIHSEDERERERQRQQRADASEEEEEEEEDGDEEGGEQPAEASKSVSATDALKRPSTEDDMADD